MVACTGGSTNAGLHLPAIAHEAGIDFLLDWPGDQGDSDWIITNPPFVQGSEFLELMLARARVGCAMFVKQQFLEGGKRYRRFFERRPPSAVFQFADRVPLVADRLDPAADTNQAYIWAVWIRDPAAARAVFQPVLHEVAQDLAELLGGATEPAG